MSDTLTHPDEGASFVAAQDAALRHWTYDTPGPVRSGSDEHRKMLCRMLLETHDPWRPAVLDWPRLEPDALQRLTSLPIWDIAVQTEGRASIRVQTCARTVQDPLLREALDMDAAEEARHKVVLSHLVETYGIELAPEPAYPPPPRPEWAWMFTGYSERIDSFFAFGLFRSAQRSGYFPAELVETFEPVIQEEARHILFFVNWVAWYAQDDAVVPQTVACAARGRDRVPAAMGAPCARAFRAAPHEAMNRALARNRRIRRTTA